MLINYGNYFSGVILYFFRGIKQIKLQYEKGLVKLN